MRKKRLIAAAAAAVLLLGTSTLAARSFGIGREQDLPIKDWQAICRSEDDEDWPVYSEGSVILENDRFRLELDTQTTHFTVTDKQSQNQYSSVPSELSDTSGAQMQTGSELTIEYYDDQSIQHTLTSAANSVAYQSYRIVGNGSTVRIYYTLRNTRVAIFAPAVLSESVMEEQIFSQLTSSQKRRLSMYYTLYTPQSGSETAQKYKEQYPALEKENLYIRMDTLQNKDLEEITGYMAAAGYTAQQYEAEAARLGQTQTEETKTAEFLVPIEYALTEDGFRMRVLTDRIVSTSQEYILQTVIPLQYFSSVKAEQDGYLLIPDGSGMVVSLNTNSGESLQRPFYGTDQAVTSQQTTQEVQNLLLPVYGQHRAGSGYLAIVEGAAEQASLRLQMAGGENPYTSVAAAFGLRGMDTTDIGKDRDMPVMNLYSEHLVYENPSVRYILLEDESSTYSDMASVYRQYLLDRGILGERLQGTGQLPLFLDFTGYVTSKTSVLGVPVNRVLVLSTLEEIGQLVGDLPDNGIQNAIIRLKGLDNGGLLHGLTDDFSLYKDVGTKEQLERLAGNLQSAGMRLYIDGDFSTVYRKDGDFIQRLDNVRRLDRSMAEFGEYSLVTKSLESPLFPRYLVAPIAYPRLIRSYLDSMGQYTSADILPSWSTAGTLLVSDFNHRQEYDRCMTRDTILEGLQLLSQNGQKDVMTDGGNGYVLPFARTIVNLPTDSSGFSVEYYTVPFYQMVVHGYVDYSGPALNLSQNPERLALSSIESGAGMYYSFITGDDMLLRNTDYERDLMPTNALGQWESMLKAYQEWNSVLGDLRNQVILRHERLMEDVFVTEYEDHTRIYVNYSSAEVRLDTVTIPAGGYAVERGSLQ